MTLLRFAFIFVFIAAPAHAAKRRAVRAPGGTTFAAYPLHSVALTSDESDLAPLDAIVRRAKIVGLGDATHGTHEFYTMRLRVVDYLIRNRNFDVISLEAPFAITERLNQYVQGAPGNPRALLADMSDRLLYFFWDVEELLALIEWMRDYNAHRGTRPRIELAGADMYDEPGAIAMVVHYLRSVDPAAATTAEQNYACVLERRRDLDCSTSAENVRTALNARNENGRAYEDARHAADAVMLHFDRNPIEAREAFLTSSLLWIREHRGASRKVIHWGHQEHVGKLPTRYLNGRPSMGTRLAEQLGPEYVAIGMLTGSGTTLQWKNLNGAFVEAPLTLPDPTDANLYEWHFRQRGIPALLIPLRGRTIPGISFRTAGTTSGYTTETQPLTQKLDAVIYIDRTTPTNALR